MSSVADAYLAVQQQVAAAAKAAGRNPDDVTLIAVSKTKPLAAIEEAYLAGARHFGENYAQELQDKATELKARCPQLQWHFIGRFQKNKINALKAFTPVWHTLASAADVQAVAQRQPGAEVLLQVNIGREPQKGGVLPEALADVLGECARIEGVQLRGLMAIPPVEADAAGSFAAMAQLAQQHRASFAEPPWLSMGMSHDFVEAIRLGATHVRVGSLIFGAR